MAAQIHEYKNTEKSTTYYLKIFKRLAADEDRIKFTQFLQKLIQCFFSRAMPSCLKSNSGKIWEGKIANLCCQFALQLGQNYRQFALSLIL